MEAAWKVLPFELIAKLTVATAMNTKMNTTRIIHVFPIRNGFKLRKTTRTPEYEYIQLITAMKSWMYVYEYVKQRVCVIQNVMWIKFDILNFICAGLFSIASHSLCRGLSLFHSITREWFVFACEQLVRPFNHTYGALFCFLPQREWCENGDHKLA